MTERNSEPATHDLIEIVTDLARQEDPSYSIRCGDVECRYCGIVGKHRETCAWRRARVVVAAVDGEAPSDG